MMTLADWIDVLIPITMALGVVFMIWAHVPKSGTPRERRRNPSHHFPTCENGPESPHDETK